MSEFRNDLGELLSEIRLLIQDFRKHYFSRESVKNESIDSSTPKSNWVILVPHIAGVLKILITVGLGTLAVAVVSENNRERSIAIASKEADAKIAKDRFELVAKYLKHGLDDNPQKRLWFAEYFASVLCEKDTQQCWQAYADKMAGYISDEQQAEIEVANLQQQVDNKTLTGIDTSALEKELKAEQAKLTELRARLGDKPTVIEGRDTRLSVLHPEFRSRLLSLLSSLNQESIPFQIFEAYRSPGRQQQLYQRGRTTTGPKVTNAAPWSSLHQYGLAVDIVLYEDGKWSWDDSGEKKHWWKRLHELAQMYGLENPTWDRGGIQLNGITLSELKKGNYPENGDHSWAEHLSSAIENWIGEPEAPPKPKIPIN
ncbi:M15 family metallopeptidase [Rheinheimera hassiensis]|uniref:M15 family metallopeptidase n=1 Tax=Rheinheimera hassiensis TaxID=1193627 RepID=UPI001F065250|nr:M15 family metallopeptidase [Rheinheimera hassiensis]